jgi:hypothetical protein
VPVETFRALPSVQEASAVDSTVTVTYQGSVDAVLKTASAYKVRAIRTHDEDIEAIFLRYYGGQAGA